MTSYRRVTCACGACGMLYQSTPFNSDRHRANAHAKGRRIAVAHTDEHPDHEVVVDPGDSPPVRCPHDPDLNLYGCKQCIAELFERARQS